VLEEENPKELTFFSLVSFGTLWKLVQSHLLQQRSILPFSSALKILPCIWHCKPSSLLIRVRCSTDWLLNSSLYLSKIYTNTLFASLNARVKFNRENLEALPNTLLATTTGLGSRERAATTSYELNTMARSPDPNVIVLSRDIQAERGEAYIRPDVVSGLRLNVCLLLLTDGI
jgi:hypothetical protein